MPRLAALALLAVLMLPAALVAFLPAPAEAALGFDVPPVPHGENLFRFYASNMTVAAHVDNGTGENPTNVCITEGRCSWALPPQTSSDCGPGTGGGAPGCVTTRLGNLAALTQGLLTKSGADSGATVMSIQKQHNASTPDNVSAIRVTLPHDAAFTNARLNFQFVITPADMSGGAVTLWAEAKAANGTVMHLGSLGSFSCTGAAIQFANLSVAVDRTQAKTFTVFANKTTCGFLGGAPATRTVNLRLGSYAYWSEHPSDLASYAVKELEHGDFLAQQEGGSSITVGVNTDLATTTNISLTVGPGKTIWGYYGLGCKGTAGAVNQCGSGAIGPLRVFGNVSDACVSHAYRGAAIVSGTNAISMWQSTNNCGSSASFRVSGFLFADTFDMRYFINHNVYFGNTFGKGGGDFDQGGASRPSAALCWSCPGRANQFTAVALGYAQDQGTLSGAPLTAGMTGGANTDFRNADTIALGFNTDQPFSSTIRLTPRTYWGNAVFAVVAVRTTAGVAVPAPCTSENANLTVNGNVATLTRAPSWNATDGNYTACFYLIYDGVRQEANREAAFNVGRSPDGSERTFQLQWAFPSSWATAQAGSPLAARGIQNFLGNKSEFLGCTVSGTANYCFGNLDTTGFAIPGLAAERRWTVCAAEGSAVHTPAGEGTFTSNVTFGSAINGATVFESSSGIARTTEAAALPANIEDRCLGTPGAIPHANITTSLSGAGTRRFEITATGFKSSFANWTGDPGADVLILVVMNRTVQGFHWQESCSTVNSTLIFCRVLPGANPAANCDNFSFTSNACFTFTATPSGQIKRWIFNCPTDAATGALIGSVAIADDISGVAVTTGPVVITTIPPTWQETAAWLGIWLIRPLISLGKFIHEKLSPLTAPLFQTGEGVLNEVAKNLNEATTEESCRHAATPLIQNNAPALRFSKVGYRTLLYNASEVDEDVVVYAAMRTGSGTSEAEVVERTRTTTVNPLNGRLRNVTAVFVRDSNSTSGSSQIPGTPDGSGVNAGSALQGFASAFGSDQGSRMLMGVVIFVAVMVGLWRLAVSFAPGADASKLVLMAGLPVFLLMGVGGFWPLWMMIGVFVALFVLGALAVRGGARGAPDG